MNSATTPPIASHEEETPYSWYAPDEGRGEAAALLTHVHPQPTTVIQPQNPPPGESAPASDVAYRFRRPDHAHAREVTIATLRGHYRHADRARRLDNCGRGATVWHSPSTDSVVIRANHCGMRCCPRCRETHSARTRETLNRFLQNVDRTRLSFVTFTLLHSDQPLADQIDRLYASFRRLRASLTWKAARPKGFAVLEVKRSEDGTQWHPHLHLLAEMPFVAKEHLADAWLAATGDSFIVDIRRINRRSVDRHRDYLCNYLTKPATAEILDVPQLLIEWIDAFLHRRVLIKFGRPTLAEKMLPPTPPTDYRLVGSLLGLLHAFERGDPDATAWLIRLGKGPTSEGRDKDAGKDYSIDQAYRTPDLPQFF